MFFNFYIEIEIYSLIGLSYHLAMTDDTKLQSSIFEALSHPIRRKILEEIAEKKEVSYTHLVELLNIKAGPLYHHIKKMNKFVDQTDDKKYILTEKGQKAFAILRASEIDDIQKLSGLQEKKILTFYGISLKPVISYFSEKPLRTLVEFLIIAVISGYLASNQSILLIGNFAMYYETNLFFYYLSIVASWLFLGGVTELIARFVFKKKRKSIHLISVSSIVFLPIFLFFIILWFIGLFTASAVILPAIVLLIMHGIFQVWTFMVLTTSLGVLKKLSIERAAISAMFVSYIQIMITIFVLIS